jgi:hypothetical protein
MVSATSIIDYCINVNKSNPYMIEKGKSNDGSSAGIGCNGGIISSVLFLEDVMAVLFLAFFFLFPNELC